MNFKLIINNIFHKIKMEIKKEFWFKLFIIDTNMYYLKLHIKYINKISKLYYSYSFFDKQSIFVVLLIFIFILNVIEIFNH